MSITKRALKTPDPVTGRKVAYLVRVENLAPHPETGKRRWRTRQVATHDGAKVLQAEWMVEFQRGTALEPSKVTVAKLLDEWVRVELPKSVRTENRQTYESITKNHPKPAIGDVPVQRLTVQHVDDQIAGMLERGLSSSHIRKARVSLIARA